MAGMTSLFKDPARGLTEVGCWAHARRYFHKALESDQARMGQALLLVDCPALSGGKASLVAGVGRTASAAPTPIAARPGEIA
jgi:hypothetical protein